MRFKHHSGIRLALTSGHITFVGTQWHDLLPLFHAEALARGCVAEPVAPVAIAKATTPVAVIAEKVPTAKSVTAAKKRSIPATPVVSASAATVAV